MAEGSTDTKAIGSTPETKAPDSGRPRRRRLRTRAGKGSYERNVWIAITIVGVAVLAVIAVVGWRFIEGRMQAAKSLDRAMTIIEDADAVVVAVDRVVREDVTSELAGEARLAQERIPEAKAKFAEALVLINKGNSSRTDDEQDLGGLLRTTAEARIAMLEQAPIILELNIKSADSLPLAQEGWDAVLAADKLSDSAVVSYNKLTKAGVEQSYKLNKQAAIKLAAAKTAFGKAEAAFPAAPFENYLAYVEMRIQLNELSQQSDQAWLKRDVAGANAIAVKYNELDKKAVAEAKKLPATPAQAVATAYQNAAGATTGAYYAARDRATAADNKLRRQ